MLSNRFDCIRHLYNSGCTLSRLKGGSVSLLYCSSIVLDNQYLSANNLSEEIKDVLNHLISYYFFLMDCVLLDESDT